jgi:hypothetical protein
MSDILNCLPSHARQHFIRLKSEKSEAARSVHTRSLADLRGESAAKGMLKSGYQLMKEWELAEGFIGDLARAYFEGAVETCSLYEIPLDARLSKCLEDGIRGFIVAQYRNAIKHSGTQGGHIKIPHHLRVQVSSNCNDCRFPIFNSILIQLENARVKSLKEAAARKAAQPMTVSNTTTKTASTLGTATVIRILIASPGDVTKERDVVSECIHAWNAAHFGTTGIMLQAVRWETHTFPESGDRPQALINRQIVEAGDCLIGLFGLRIGTPTGDALSGTIEEIEMFRKAGKHVSLYFSSADVPRSADRDQLAALEAYQRERQKDTLYFEFADPEKLRQLVTQHLPGIVNTVVKQSNSTIATVTKRALAEAVRPAFTASWPAKEIALEARYLGNKEVDRIVLACQSIDKTPGKYVNDVGADQHVMQSEIEPPALLVRGADVPAVEKLGWTPMSLSFHDGGGQLQEFSGSLGYTEEPNTIRFMLHG